MVAALAALAVVAPTASASAWGQPFQLAGPGTLDYVSPELAFSPQGAAAAAFGIENVDAPGSAQAYLSSRTAAGRVSSPRAVTGARQVLALAYDGRSLELLTGTSPQGLDCCSAVQAIQVGDGGRQARARTLVGGLAGATVGQLLTLGDGQMLAVVATARGVWVAQSTRGNRFGGQHLLSGRRQEPEAMSAAWLGGERTIVAWTAGTGTAGATDPRTIDVSSGTRTSAPRRAHAALTIPSGHRIDELAIGRRGHAATLAWTESWYDRRGTYHSRVEAADVGARARTRAISPDNRLASGLSLAADPAGDQALAWKACTSAGACTTQAAGRPARGGFGAARTLGAIDAAGAPALVIAPTGRVVVAWVRGGQPVASAAFGNPTVLSRTTYAVDVTAAYGPRRQALVAWTQGTLHPSLVAAAYRG